MINALVFGANGQLGRSLALCGAAFPKVRLTLLDRSKCDLSDLSSIAAVIRNNDPQVIINAAAYTAVDLAENDRDSAYRVNCDAADMMARAADDLDMPLIHFSTDYVFGGASQRPYCEDDPVAPLGVYGASKLAGESAVRAAAERHLILRTAWVYSPFGKNFVKTMLGLMAQRDVLTIVNDQHGCPTSAIDLVNATLRLLPVILDPNFYGFGTYHLVSDNQMTWFDFAKRIQDAAIAQFGANWTGKNCRIDPVNSDAFPTIAKRPAYSIMSTQKFTDTFGYGLPDISESLPTCLNNLEAGR